MKSLPTHVRHAAREIAGVFATGLVIAAIIGWAFVFDPFVPAVATEVTRSAPAP